MMEMLEIDLDSSGNVLPPKIDKIALIDADTIAYTSCLNAEVEIEVLPREFYSDSEWEEIKDSIVDGYIYQTSELEALEKADSKIQKILEKTGCSSVELHFSSGRSNFRNDIYPEYKANRTVRTPEGLSKLKENMTKKYGGTTHTKWEADDMVVYLATKYPDKYVLAAVDKDVLNSVPGKNFNYYESGLYNIDMKWIEVDRYTANIWRYKQTLMGDKTDNIIGLKGIGPAKTDKILADKYTHKELWEAVLEAYKLKGRDKADALLNLNLVDMKLLYEDVNGELKIKLNTHKELLSE